MEAADATSIVADENVGTESVPDKKEKSVPPARQRIQTRNRPTISNFLVVFSRANYGDLDKILGDRAELIRDLEKRTQMLRGRGGIKFTKDIFARVVVTFTVSNAYPAIPNALRRVMMDECSHYVLVARDDAGHVDESFADPFSVNSYVAHRIGNIPLRYKVQDKHMTFKLVAENNSPVPKYVYAGDLTITYERARTTKPHPGQRDATTLPFDPRYEIAYLQPGKRIEIPLIEIVESNSYTGMGPKSSFGLHGRIVALGLEEYPHEETHKKGGSQVDNSGYKLSSLVAEPRKHLVEITFTQIEEDNDVIKEIHITACTSIIARLKKIKAAISAAMRKTAEAKDRNGISYVDGDVAISLVITHGAVGTSENLYDLTITIKNETWTISELLNYEVLEYHPDILYCASDVRTVDKGMTLVIKSDVDPLQIVGDATGRLVDIFDGFITDFRRM